MRRFVTMVAAIVASAMAHAGPIQLVKDINRTLMPPYANGDPVAFGGSSILTLCYDTPQMTIQGNFCDPWITDGTQAGTRQIHGATSYLSNLLGAYVNWGGLVYFFNGLTLFRTDGTDAGTAAVTTLAGSTTNDIPARIVPTPSLMYVITPDSQLWRSDGTAAGTFALASGVHSLAVLGDRVVFDATDAATGDEVYVTDGSVAGTSRVADLDPGRASSSPTGFTTVGTRVLFWTGTFSSTTLWATDGTAAGTQQILAPPSSVRLDNRDDIVEMAGAGYVVLGKYASTTGSGWNDIWRTDGTAAGTSLLKQTTSGYSYANPIVKVGSTLYTPMNDGNVWLTDGTIEGTVPLSVPETLTSYANPVAVGNRLYFSANGKVMMAQGGSAVVASNLQLTPWAALGGSLVLKTPSVTWLLDGSGNVAPLIPASGQPTNSSRCSTNFVAAGNIAYFCASDGVHGGELWRTDGTDGGTAMVADVNPAPGSGSFADVSLVTAGNFVYYLGRTPASASVLMRSDGTAAGTVPLKDLTGRTAQIAPWGNSLMLMWDTQLWRVDAGSNPVMLLDARSSGIGPLQFAAATSHYAFFTAFGSDGMHLFASDGASSTLVDLGLASVVSIVSIGDVVVYSRDNGSTIWRSDGTPAGTYQLASQAATGALLSAGGKAFFAGAGGLYRTDGTVAGTSIVLSPAPFTWASDGQFAWFAVTTSPTTMQLYMLPPYASTPSFVANVGVIQNLTAAGASAFFFQSTPSTGWELWRSDGTAAGTGMVEDFEPGTASFVSAGIYPGLPPLNVVGGNLLFFAAHAGMGWEPHRIALRAASSLASARRMDFNADGSGDLVDEHADGSVEIRLMQGITVAAAATIVPDAAGHVVTTSGDFDGDGKPDLLFRRTDGGVEMWLMDGTTVKQSALIMPPGTGWSIAHVGDFDGDGKSDLLWQNTNGSVGLWLMNGSVARTRASLMPNGATWVPVHVGDFNGDGMSDVLWRNSADGSVSMWLMNGPLVADRGSLLPAGTPWAPLHVADFDGDAKSDILWQSTDGGVSMWMMNGRASVSRAQVMGPNTSWTVTNTADFNGDGKADLVWLSRDGTVGTWLMNGGTVLEKRTQFTAGSGWSCSVAQDLSGDGKADIVWSNTSGAVGAWLMDGTSNTARAPLESAGSTNKLVPLQFHH